MIYIFIYQNHPQDAKRVFYFVRYTVYSPMLTQQHGRVINQPHFSPSIRTHKNSWKHR